MNQKQLSCLMADVRRGNADAFAAIYSDMRVPVFTVIYRIVGCREEAEDVMQEVFLRLFRAPPGDEVRDLRCYIFRMAHNAAADLLRRRGYRRHDPLDDDIIAPGEDIAVRIDIEAALAALEDDERRAVVLHVNAGLTLAQTASVMERNISSVYRSYRSAIKKLRQKLG